MNKQLSAAAKPSLLSLALLLTCLTPMLLKPLSAYALTGDINGDGSVNTSDLTILESDWGTTTAAADLNGNGKVDIFDLSILLSNWGGSGGGSSVAPPIAPQSYSIPSGAVLVSNSAQLISALNAGDANIELADGTYSNSTYFSDTTGSSLYAQHLGGATLTAGVVIGGNSAGGAVIQGLAFNVSNSSLTYNGADIYLWGNSGNNTSVLDTTFAGNWTIPFGLIAYTDAGLNAQRLVFTDFLDGALRADSNTVVTYGGTVSPITAINDISINGVSENPPGSSNGTGEAGLFVGEPVTNGIHRIKIRNVSISGIETVNNFWNTTLTDLDIDMSGPYENSGVGVYMEHYTYYATFNNFIITGANRGIHGEYDDEIAGNAAAHHTLIENGTIDATGANNIDGCTDGIYLDYGTDSTTVHNVAFKNQSQAGIDYYNNIGTNDFSGNFYNLAPGAVDTTTAYFCG